MIIVGISNRKLSIDFYNQIKKISKSKLDYLIIREKDLSDEELLELSLKVKQILKGTKIKLIVNSNITVAKRIDADGIQVSFKDFMKINKKLYTQNLSNGMKIENNFKVEENNNFSHKIIGVSIHSYEEGAQAYKLGADYVVYGHVFQTNCKRNLEPRGVEEIIKLSKQVNIPVIGLGGINQKNYMKVIRAGANGIAVMSSLMQAKNPKELIGRFKV